jgi:hypothetical protein
MHRHARAIGKQLLVELHAATRALSAVIRLHRVALRQAVAQAAQVAVSEPRGVAQLPKHVQHYLQQGNASTTLLLLHTLQRLLVRRRWRARM